MARWVAGVDGCKGGWIAAFRNLDHPDNIVFRKEADLADIVDGPEQPDVVAVDMPIGLPEAINGPGRMPEQLVRPLLGRLKAAVFSMPSRRAVEAQSFQSACCIAAETSRPSRKISKQSFAIFPKILAIDALLRARPDLRKRVHEVHPEVAFWSMNGEVPLPYGKKAKGRSSELGLTIRRELLVQADIPRRFTEPERIVGVGADDFLDALAGLVVAGKIAQGQGRPFPDPPDRDAHGLQVAIWTFRN
ncbi:MAG TPA: DUF429 domain-containing protein [Microvirga sp.]|jgi:predicted RNase H-like nuclease